MKVIPQYKVIATYNYDRIIYNEENIYAKRQDTYIGLINGKMHLIFFFFVIRSSKRFQTP